METKICKNCKCFIPRYKLLDGFCVDICLDPPSGNNIENFKDFNRTLSQLNSHPQCCYYQRNVWFLPQNKICEIPPDCIYKFERELLDDRIKITGLKKYLLKGYLLFAVFLALPGLDLWTKEK